jgi:hypothetical protein
MGSRRPWVITAIACATFAALLTAAAGAASSPPWSKVDTPNPLNFNGAGDSLDSISCVGTNWCVSLTGLGDEALEWNGSRWISLAIPLPRDVPSGPTVVSCSNRSFCVALGYSLIYPTEAAPPRTPVWTWNGHFWSRTTLPQSRSGYWFDAVSCPTTTFCVAVGGDNPLPSSLDAPYAEQWNGSMWQAMSIPSPGGGSLYGVSCTGPRFCVAVGESAGSTLAEVWSGTSWAAQSTPNAISPPVGGDQLQGVSCASTRRCVAVGYAVAPDPDGGPGSSEAPAAIAYDGKSWTALQPTLLSSSKSYEAGEYLTAVSCADSTQCVIVGNTSIPITFDLTGSSFAYERTWAASSVAGPELDAIACSHSVACFAVGGYETRVRSARPISQTLVERNW